jgi:type IV secretion system protein TrbL
VCNPLDLTCAATKVAASAFDSIVESAGKAAAEMIGNAMTFWVGTETVNPDSPAVQNLQRYTVPVSAVILTGSVMVQGIRMMLSRKKDPLIAVAVDLIRYAVIHAIGLTTLALGVQAADAIAQALVDQGLNDYAERMKGIFTQGIDTNGAFSLLLLALIGFLLGMLQWLLAFVRTAGLLVLAALLTLAAARAEWMKRIVPWALTLVAYKPMAAMIYVIGFQLMGDGQDVSTRLTGLMVLALAAVAMPAMMRFFAWSSGATSGGSGVGGGLAAGAMGIAARGGFGGGGGGAAQTAQGTAANGPGSSPAGARANPAAGPPPSPSGAGRVAGGGVGGVQTTVTFSPGGAGAAAGAGAGAGAGAAAAAGPAGAAVAGVQAASQSANGAAGAATSGEPPPSNGPSGAGPAPSGPPPATGQQP